MTAFFGKPRSKIVFAADLPTKRENCDVLDVISDHIDVIKVNTPLLLRESPKIIEELRERYRRPVFADVKIADVPHTSRGITKLMKDAGAAAVMVHGIVGPDCIQDCIDVANGQLGIVVQIELTHPGGVLFTQRIADDMATVAAALDVYGVQAPGNRPERVTAIRKIVGDSIKIVCCGVGAQGGRYQTVLQAGGDYAIIGRAIYESDDPLAAIGQLTST